MYRCNRSFPGVLHTIFFHRYFPSIRPSLHDLPHLDITLPYIADPPELETLIDARTASLIHQLTSTNTPNGGVRGQIAVQFFDKKRRKSGWLTGIGRGNEEEICWEEWLVEVTLAKPKTESGMSQSRSTVSVADTLCCLCRARQGSKSHGELSPEDRHEDRGYRQQG